MACHTAYRSDLTWYHLVVEHGGRYYVSLVEFSNEILRNRLKIHPAVQFDWEFGLEHATDVKRKQTTTRYIRFCFTPRGEQDESLTGSALTLCEPRRCPHHRIRTIIGNITERCPRSAAKQLPFRWTGGMGLHGHSFVGRDFRA